MESIQTEELQCKKHSKQYFAFYDCCSNIVRSNSSPEKLVTIVLGKFNTHKISWFNGEYLDRGAVCKKHSKQYFAFYDCCSQQFRAIVLLKSLLQLYWVSLTHIKLAGLMESFSTENMFVKCIANLGNKKFSVFIFDWQANQYFAFYGCCSQVVPAIVL